MASPFWSIKPEPTAPPQPSARCLPGGLSQHGRAWARDGTAAGTGWVLRAHQRDSDGDLGGGVTRRVVGLLGYAGARIAGREAANRSNRTKHRGPHGYCGLGGGRQMVQDESSLEACPPVWWDALLRPPSPSLCLSFPTSPALCCGTWLQQSSRCQALC